LLGGELQQVLSVFGVARRSIRIALQSIWIGIGLSVICMIAAAFGHIPPLVGSLLQEGIDILVIVNALRASRSVV
jgi:cation transport ATPase